MDWGERENLQNKEMRKEDNDVCPDCKGTGMIIEKDGQCHTCWRCLREGRLDVHSKKIPDTNIKL